MFSATAWSLIIIGECMAYLILASDKVETTYESKAKSNKNNSKDTYEYFSKLTLDYQKKYYNNNLDLKYYKNDSTVGLTDDKHFNAKHASEISRRTGKAFTNIDKTY